MSISLQTKLVNGHSGINDAWHVEHHVYEQQIKLLRRENIRTDKLDRFGKHIPTIKEKEGFVVNLNTDNFGDRVKVRGLFIDGDVQNASVVFKIGGTIINKIPLRLIKALNKVNDIPNYMDFSFDVFFGDSIYVHLFHRLMLLDMTFVDVPDEIKEIGVVFEGCWLNNKELARLNDITMDHFIKQPIAWSLPNDKIVNHLSIQNILVCERKDNIKRVKYDCLYSDRVSDEQVNVFDYDERLSAVYGIKVNDNVTCFNMNPGKPWDCHYSEGNFNVSKFIKEKLVVERKDGSDAPIDVFFLTTNQLHYEKGMCGLKFAY
jgi:hypothetical protein